MLTKDAILTVVVTIVLFLAGFVISLFADYFKLKSTIEMTTKDTAVLLVKVDKIENDMVSLKLSVARLGEKLDYMLLLQKKTNNKT